MFLKYQPEKWHHKLEKNQSSGKAHIYNCIKRKANQLLHQYNPGSHLHYVQFLKHPIYVRCAYGVLLFTICVPEPPPLLAGKRDNYQWMLLLIHFFLLLSQKIGMFHLVMLYLDFSNIQEFSSVHGHKFWSVPTKFSPPSLQTGIQIRDWYSMRWSMSSWLLCITKGIEYYFKPIAGHIITDPEMCALQLIIFLQTRSPSTMAIEF